MEERLAFMGISGDTLATIRKNAHLLLPHKAQIVDQFYQTILSRDHLKKIIDEHSTVDRLKKTMTTYLEQLLEAKVDINYVNTRVIVGQVHSRIRLTSEHFISAHHLLIQAMTTILMQELRRQPETMMKAVLAIQKLGAFDQQLIVEVYTEETFKFFLFGVSDMLNHVTELSTTKQLVQAMEEQIKESQSVSAAAEQMSASIEQVAAQAAEVANGTQDAVQFAIDGKEVIHRVVTVIQNLGQVYENVMNEVKELHHHIESTQNVVQIVRDIADQTNLLALNASIQAAHAGEHGRGFAVVAAEVRQLAEHTKEQIAQITQNMHTLQEVSSEVTEQIGATGQLMEASMSGVQNADGAMEKNVAVIQEIHDAMIQIAAMAQEQTSSVTDIAHRNTEIDRLGVYSQQIAQESAQTLFQLSQQMDKYRSTFFDVNMKFNHKDTVKIAKTDHLLFKWKIYNALLGVETMDGDDVASYQNCRLGKWYYGNLPEKIKTNPAFVKLEEPHQKVHRFAKEAVEQFISGQRDQAQATLELLQAASNQVVSLLNQLEQDL